MKKNRFLAFVALACALSVLLSGCLIRGGDWIFDDDPPTETRDLGDWGGSKGTDPTEETEDPGDGELGGKWQDTQNDRVPAFEDMEYVRPDIDAYLALVESACDDAMSARRARDVEEGVFAIYDAYDEFYTMMSLADIRYSLDLRDPYYQEEYQYCSEQSALIDQGLENYYRALAQCPVAEELEGDDYFGEGFLDQYQGESFYTEELMALLTKESTLQSEVYALMNELNELEYYSEEYFQAGYEPMGELLVELVKVRQDIARETGCQSYSEFAYSFYYGRDYSPEQADEYLLWIQEELVPLYRQVNDSNFWSEGYDETVTADACRRYLSGAVENMGGKLLRSYKLMEEKNLSDLSPSPYKYTGSFEVYLTSFGAPYLFMNPREDWVDYLTFAHEFGHFSNDYFCGGSMVSVDVSEFFSQGLEYLSLCYGPGDVTDLDRLRKMKLADSLNTYVEQAAYARFETEIYSLPAEELTPENLGRIYEEVCRDYGFDSWNWDKRDWITISHFYLAPYYVVSYVVSNDIAMQLYEMEQKEPGSGAELYGDFVGGSEPSFVAFVEETGLESPFSRERLKEVCETLKTILK